VSSALTLPVMFGQALFRKFRRSVRSPTAARDISIAPRYAANRPTALWLLLLLLPKLIAAVDRFWNHNAARAPS